MSELARELYPFWQTAIFLIFAGIAVWAFWPSAKRKEEMKRNAEIPLREDDKEHA